MNLEVMEMGENVEENPGGFLPVNSDFDEQNSNGTDWVPDNEPDQPHGHRIVGWDCELRDGYLFVGGEADSGTWTINYSSNRIKLWHWDNLTQSYVFIPDGHHQTQSLPVHFTFLIEGIVHSDALRDVSISASASASGGSGTDSEGEGGPDQNDGDTVKLTVVEVDADVDSDNDNGFDPPERNAHEERIEDQVSELGKIVTVNDGDVDNDGIPDFADGYDLDRDGAGDDRSLEGVKFVRYVLDLSGVAFSSQAWLRFGYSASDPALFDPAQPNGSNGVRRTGSGTAQDPYVYTPGPGLLRLWTKDARFLRNSKPVRDGGDYVAPLVSYTLADFGITATNATITLWLEQVAPSAQVQTITVEIDPDGGGNAAGAAGMMSADAVRVSGIKTRLVPVCANGQPMPGTPAPFSSRLDCPLIASNRFCRFCVEHDLTTGWVPVRVEP